MPTFKKYCHKNFRLYKIVKIAASAFILLSILSTGCSQPLIFKYMSANESGYYMFGKMPERVFHEKGSIDENMQLIWSAETDGSQSNSSIIIYKDILFVTDLSGKIYGYDRLTGKKLGYEKYSGSIPVAPVITGLRMFLVVNDLDETYSTIKYYDLIGGKVLSESRITGNVDNELIKLKDGIVLLSDKGELIKYNLIGTREWSLQTKVNSQSSPASNGRLILFGNENGELIAVSADEGKLIYRKKISDGIEGDICIDGRNAYFGDNQGSLFSVDINEGNVNWKYGTKNKILATPVFDGSRVIVGNLAGTISCVNKIDGSPIWNINSGGVINTAPLLMNNLLIQPDFNRKILFIDIKTGEIKKIYEYEKRVKLSPVLYDGILYVGADKGIINAYKTFSK